MDLSPLFISLKATFISTVITFFTGIAAGYYVQRLGRVWKGVLDCLFTMPMVLPPTVVGYFLLLVFGLNSPVGRMLMEHFGTRIVFTPTAAVISSAVVSFPLMYRTARGVFEQFDPVYIYSAQTLGLSNAFIFWRIILPNSKYGIIAGAVLSFARGLGEFGATIMLAGNIPGKTQTISVAVYSAISAGNNALAYKWVLVNFAISLSAMLIMNLVNGRAKRTSHKHRSKLRTAAPIEAGEKGEDYATAS